MPLSSDIVANRYEKNDLASEFLQVGHHGYGGGSDALDTASDPETLLWPCPAFWYPSVRLWRSNDVLRNSPHIKHILMAGFGSVTLDMTKPVEDAPKRSYNAGDTVYEEDFQTKKRLVDLGYESVTGGATGLVPANTVLKQTLSADIWRLKLPTPIPLSESLRKIRLPALRVMKRPSRSVRRKTRKSGSWRPAKCRTNGRARIRTGLRLPRRKRRARLP